MGNKGFLVVGVIIGCAYLLGRHHAPDRVVTEVKTVYVDRIVESEQENKTETVTEKIKELPSGEKLTVRKIKTQSQKESKKDTSSKITQELNKIEVSQDYTSLKVLVDIDRNFGLSVSRKVLGPLEIGLFGFTDGRIGASVGIQF